MSWLEPFPRWLASRALRESDKIMAREVDDNIRSLSMISRSGTPVDGCHIRNIAN